MKRADTAVKNIKKGSLKTLFRSIKYLLPYKYTAAGVLLSLLLSTAINLAIPKAMQIVIDRGITLRVPRIIILGSGLIIAFSLMGALFSFIQGYLATRVSHGVANSLLLPYVMQFNRPAIEGRLMHEIQRECPGIGGAVISGFFRQPRTHFVAVRGLTHPVTLSREILGQDANQPLVVIDNENSRSGEHVPIHLVART